MDPISRRGSGAFERGARRTMGDGGPDGASVNSLVFRRGSNSTLTAHFEDENSNSSWLRTVKKFLAFDRNPGSTFLHATLERRGGKKWLARQQNYNWERVETEKFAQHHQTSPSSNPSSKTFDFLKSKSAADDKGAVFLAVTLLLLVAIGCGCSVMTLAFEAVEHYMEAFYRKYAGKEIGKLIFGEEDETGQKWYYCFHMVVGCCLSAGVCNYIARTYIPECSGAGTDASRIAMAIGSPINFRIGVYRILMTSMYLAMGNPYCHYIAFPFVR